MIMMRSADGKVALDAGAKDEEYGSAKCHSGNKLYVVTLLKSTNINREVSFWKQIIR